MKIFWGILGIIITLYIRIRIINNSFKTKKIKSKISISIFILSLILVSFLYFYKDILGIFGLQNLYFHDNVSMSTILSFIFYCLSFLILLSIGLKNIKDKKNINYIVVAVILFTGIGIGGVLMGINTLIMYYLVSCYAEEILKFSVGENILLKEGKDKGYSMGDLVLFAILAGLGFSAIENVFYLVVLSFSGESFMFLSMGRSIFTTLLHIAATGLIAFFIVKKQNSNMKYWFKCLLGILSGFLLHWAYNLSLESNYTIITILILIICYFILSYLLFNSDLIYKKDNENI